jgi:SAM-dependent methyltransferase
MEKITDWNSLWRELVEIKARSRRMKRGYKPEGDIWAEKALAFREGVKRRWTQPDSSRDFILSQMDTRATVLDIGAGTGAWSILLSRRAKRVTAIEPSGAMVEVMRQSLVDEGIKNVTIVQGSWPDVSVKPHDFSLCSHAMYDARNLAGFVVRMAACTRRMCFLLLRAPALDGVRAEAARHIWGQPLDSPNFTIAYNILLQTDGEYRILEAPDEFKPRGGFKQHETLYGLGRVRRIRQLPDETIAAPTDTEKRKVCMAARRTLGAGILACEYLDLTSLKTHSHLAPPACLLLNCNSETSIPVRTIAPPSHSLTDSIWSRTQ